MRSSLFDGFAPLERMEFLLWGGVTPQIVRVWLLQGGDERDATLIEVRARGAKVAVTNCATLQESLTRAKAEAHLDFELRRHEHHEEAVISSPALGVRMSVGPQRVRLPARDVMRSLVWVEVEPIASTKSSVASPVGVGRVPAFCTQWPAAVRGWTPAPIGSTVRHGSLPANGAGLCRAKSPEAECAIVRSTQRAYGSDG